MSIVDKKLQIFISSTSLDLQEERQAAVEAILKTNNIPSGMEYFNPDGRDTLDIIYSWIDDSDIFVLILGGRYGKLDMTSQKSFTHLEYEYAKSKEKVIITIILTDSFLEEKLKVLGFGATETKNQLKYDDFKKMLKDTGKYCLFCDSLSDIRNGISNAVPAAKKVREFTGWVSGRELDLLNAEIKKLQELNQKLMRSVSLTGYYSKTISLEDYKVIEESHYPINPSDIDIYIESINYIVDKFEVHFTMKNNSNSYLISPGIFKFKTDPEMYEDEINTSGYSQKPKSGITRASYFVYPDEFFEGYNIYNMNREFEFQEISYTVKLKDGVDVPIRKWNREEIQRILANDI